MIKKETLAQVFYCDVCEISQNAFFREHLWVTASGNQQGKNLCTQCIFNQNIQNQVLYHFAKSIYMQSTAFLDYKIFGFYTKYHGWYPMW